MCLYILLLYYLHIEKLFFFPISHILVHKKKLTHIKAERLKLLYLFKLKTSTFQTPIYLSFIHCFLKLQYINCFRNKVYVA